MAVAVHPRMAQLAVPEAGGGQPAASANQSDTRASPGLCTASLQSADPPASELANPGFGELVDSCRVGWVKVKGWPWWPVRCPRISRLASVV